MSEEIKKKIKKTFEDSIAVKTEILQKDVYEVLLTGRG